MKRIAIAMGVATIVSYGANAQTNEQLIKGATDTSNVLNYGMGYNLNRFSTLNQINKDNVKNLVPVWNYSFADDRSEEVIQTLAAAARTGKIGDGKIFVFEVTEAVRIRNNDRGDTAL